MVQDGESKSSESGIDLAFDYGLLLHDKYINPEDGLLFSGLEPSQQHSFDFNSSPLTFNTSSTNTTSQDNHNSNSNRFRVVSSKRWRIRSAFR